MEIEEGDVVWLNSSAKSCEADYKSIHACIAPKMTVSKIQNGVAFCVFWDGNSYKQDSFNLHVLSVV